MAPGYLFAPPGRTLEGNPPVKIILRNVRSIYGLQGQATLPFLSYGREGVKSRTTAGKIIKRISPYKKANLLFRPQALFLNGLSFLRDLLLVSA